MSRTKVVVGIGVGGVVGAALAAMAACRQVAGITDAPPMALTASACGLDYGTTACAACMNASCCKESMDCGNGNPACLAYESCLGACKGDPQCRAQCTYDNRISSGSAGPISTLQACLVTHCEMQCGLSCGGVADYIAPPSAAVACEACVQDSACEVGNECGKSAECDAYVRCLLSSVTLDGHEACATQYPVGFALFGDPAGFSGPSAADTFASTYAGACRGACKYGGNWGCVGHPASSTQPHATTTNITLEGVHDPSGQRIAGATVEACLDSDTDCGSPLAVETTGDAGEVSLSVATLQANQNRVQGVSIFWKATAPGRLPAYEYLITPLGEQSLTVPAGDSPFLDTPAEFTMIGQDPNLGALYVGTADCLGSLAPAVMVTANDAGPSAYLTSTNKGTQDASASAGPAFFQNLPEGPVQVTATPLALGRPSGTFTVYVHAGAYTEFGLAPTLLAP